MQAIAPPALAPVIAPLPLDFDFLAPHFIGRLVLELKWTWRRASVFAALLSHANTEHDLAWPGVDCLAAESGTSESTVKRTTADLKREGYLEVLDNREVPRDGPGQHNYEGERRSEKRLPTNNYLLSPLARLIPPELIERVCALLDLARRRDQPHATPLAAQGKINPDSPSPVAEATMRRSAEEYSGPDLDPFAPADSELTFKAQSGLTPAVCNVAINSTDGEAEGPGGTRSVARTARSGSISPAPAGPPFHRSADQPASGSGVLEVRFEPNNKERIALAGVGFQMLKGIGVKPWKALQIVENPPAEYRDRGSLFAALLARYAKRRSQRGEISTTMAAYAVATWKGWPDGDRDWPTWFDDTVAEVARQFGTQIPESPPMEYFVERENEKPAKNIPSVRPSSAPPPSRPSSPPLPLPSSLPTLPEERGIEEILAALSKEERADLEERAVAAALLRCPAESKVAGRIRAEGLGHRGVRTEARRILDGG